jgi:hypothetical protein
MDPMSAVSTAVTVRSHAIQLLKGAAEQAKSLGKSEIIDALRKKRRCSTGYTLW